MPKPDIGGKSWGPCRNIAIMFGVEKLHCRMVWLPGGENFLNICLFVSTEYTNVTDTQADGRTPHDGCAYV